MKKEKINYAAMPTFCIVDKKVVPAERAARRSNTCDRDCARVLRNIRRAQADLRRCRICGKPSTPEERKLFQGWRRSHPDFKPAPKGRPRTKAVSASQ